MCTITKQLLRFTDLTMDEISVEVGMDSANYFSRAFHKVEGISPSEYRKQW
ncbi:helix-turn-helix domain-containing protein [[Ruminococcus] torques]|uniref:helix-turn-helix domain-containing protein n=1 Tax=[Ruminococcus] torques TaxID=33039 RepID=UPI002E8DE829|nr:helix-turn-helix domain-containing protein [[Ruminococcus] torques]